LILVFAAMQTEVRTCLGGLRDYREAEVSGFPIVEADGIVICQTGLGRRSKDAATAVISRNPADVVLSVGVAGGLAQKHGCGDVIVCETIDHESHRGAKTRVECVTSDARLVPAAVAAAEGLGLPVTRGSSLTLDEPAWDADAKAYHHAWKSHDIVEMESFWIGDAAAKAGVPFVAIRTISDTSGHALPNTGSVQPDGSFDQQRFLDYAREHPETAELIAQTAECSRAAFGNLAIVMTAFLPPLIAHFSAGVR
jgi:adenosylhomocysteine nucleosidase